MQDDAYTLWKQENNIHSLTALQAWFTERGGGDGFWGYVHEADIEAYKFMMRYIYEMPVTRNSAEQIMAVLDTGDFMYYEDELEELLKRKFLRFLSPDERETYLDGTPDDRIHRFFAPNYPSWQRSVCTQAEELPLLRKSERKHQRKLLWLPELVFPRDYAKTAYAIRAGFCAGLTGYAALRKACKAKKPLPYPIRVRRRAEGFRVKLLPAAFLQPQTTIAVAVSQQDAAPTKTVLCHPTGTMRYRSTAFGAFAEEKTAALLQMERVENENDTMRFFISCAPEQDVEIAAVYGNYVEILWRSGKAEVCWPSQGIAPLRLDRPPAPDDAEQEPATRLGGNVWLRKGEAFSVLKVGPFNDRSKPVLVITDTATNGQLYVTVEVQEPMGFSNSELVGKELLSLRAKDNAAKLWTSVIWETDTLAWVEFFHSRAYLEHFGGLVCCGGLALHAFSVSSLRTLRHFASEVFVRQ